MKRPVLPAILQALLAAILFGASAPLSRLLLANFDPILLAGSLYLGCGIASGLLLTLQRFYSQNKSEAGLKKKDLPWLAGAILAGGVLAPILLMFGLKHTPASSASLLLNFESVATLLIAWFFFREAVGKRLSWAVGFITLGSILLSWTGGQWGFSIWALTILVACTLWGLDNNLTRHISSRNPLSITLVKGLVAGGFSLILGLMTGRSLPELEVFLVALLVGALSYGLSLYLFILALRGLGAARTGALFGAAPFAGALLSFMILHERPAGWFWLALAPMLISAWLMLSEDHQHEHAHALLQHDHNHDHADAHHVHLHENGSLAVQGRHAHPHIHPRLAHAHPHAPDLHHRHGHDD